MTNIHKYVDTINMHRVATLGSPGRLSARQNDETMLAEPNEDAISSLLEMATNNNSIRQNQAVEALDLAGYPIIREPAHCLSDKRGWMYKKLKSICMGSSCIPEADAYSSNTTKINYMLALGDDSGLKGIIPRVWNPLILQQLVLVVDVESRVKEVETAFYDTILEGQDWLPTTIIFNVNHPVSRYIYQATVRVFSAKSGLLIETKTFRGKEPPMFPEKSTKAVNDRYGSQIDYWEIVEWLGNLVDPMNISKIGSHHTNFRMLQTVISMLIPEGLILNGLNEGNVTFNGTCLNKQRNQMLEGFGAQAMLRFDHASYLGLEISASDVNLTISQGVCIVEPFESVTNQGKLNIGCRIDLMRRPRTISWHEPIQIAQNVHITGALAAHLLKYVNPIFANLTKMEGRLDFNSQQFSIPAIFEAKDDLLLIGTISMREIQLDDSSLLFKILRLHQSEPLDFQELTVYPTLITIQHGFVCYKDMIINVGDNMLCFSGAISLDDSETMDMTVTLPYAYSNSMTSMNKTSKEFITLHLGGTISNPKLELDLERLLEKRNIKEELTELLESSTDQ